MKTKMSSSKIFTALFLMLFITACGKQIAPPRGMKQNQKQIAAPILDAETIEKNEVAKSAESLIRSLSVNETLQAYSQFDVNTLKTSMIEGNLYRRALFQIAPKEMIAHVERMDLILQAPEVESLKTLSLCVSDQCISITDEIKNAKAAGSAAVTLDLRKVFQLEQKTEAEIVKWIYDNTTEYTHPGYRKFRFEMSGLKSIECGEVVIQTILKQPLPDGFSVAAGKPINDEDDTYEAAKN